MTLIQSEEGKAEDMDGSAREERSKPSRPVRNRRYTRRSLVSGQRPQKRLFTPEIKRYLKDWLVRRRENPYPNREEKKVLSRETGLTYIQICNWFANWRRKLKNVNAERNQLTWGHLIRTYNDRAHGNVEQFSICSDDSIWSEQGDYGPSEHDFDTPQDLKDYKTDDTDGSNSWSGNFNNNCDEIDHRNGAAQKTSPVLLTKWLESAARFKPSDSNYSWWPEGKRKKTEPKVQHVIINNLEHDRDEVEAAMALTTLAASRIGVI